MNGSRASTGAESNEALQLQRADITHHENIMNLREHELSLREKDVILREHDLSFSQKELIESRLLLATDQCVFDERQSDYNKSTASMEALRTQTAKKLSQCEEMNDADKIVITKQKHDLALKNTMLAEASASHLALSETVAQMKNEESRIKEDTLSVHTLGSQLETQKSSNESLKKEIVVLQQRIETLSASHSSSTHSVASRRNIVNVNMSGMPPYVQNPSSSTRSGTTMVSAHAVRSAGASAAETRRINSEKEWCELRDRELPSRSRLQAIISKQNNSSIQDDFSNNIFSEINRSLQSYTTSP